MAAVKADPEIGSYCAPGAVPDGLQHIRQLVVVMPTWPTHQTRSQTPRPVPSINYIMICIYVIKIFECYKSEFFMPRAFQNKQKLKGGRTKLLLLWYFLHFYRFSVLKAYTKMTTWCQPFSIRTYFEQKILMVWLSRYVPLI